MNSETTSTAGTGSTLNVDFFQKPNNSKDSSLNRLEVVSDQVSRSAFK